MEQLMTLTSDVRRVTLGLLRSLNGRAGPKPDS
jgi:hypothetical protein